MRHKSCFDTLKCENTEGVSISGFRYGISDDLTEIRNPISEIVSRIRHHQFIGRNFTARNGPNIITGSY